MILGSRRAAGAELKVMSAVEHKTKGFYVGEDKKLRNRLDQVGDGEGTGSDTTSSRSSRTSSRTRSGRR